MRKFSGAPLRGTLDLHKIRDRFGPDRSMSFDALKWKRRCSRCGGREIDFLSSRKL